MVAFTPMPTRMGHAVSASRRAARLASSTRVNRVRKVPHLCRHSNNSGGVGVRRLRVKAEGDGGSGTGGEGVQPLNAMNVEQASALLGVREGASFDEILRAKNKLLDGTDDMDLKVQVDAAYDMLLMQSFKSRQAGNVSDSSIKYADVKPVKPPELPGWAKGAVEKLPSTPTVELSNPQNSKVQAGTFALLLLWSAAQGLSPSDGSGSNIPTTQLALAFALSTYFLREQKRLPLSRAALLTTGGLVAGALTGGALQAWLRVDIVPVGPLDSPEVLVSELALVAIWATCTLLA